MTQEHDSSLKTSSVALGGIKEVCQKKSAAQDREHFLMTRENQKEEGRKEGRKEVGGR